MNNLSTQWVAIAQCSKNGCRWLSSERLLKKLKDKFCCSLERETSLPPNKMITTTNLVGCLCTQSSEGEKDWHYFVNEITNERITFFKGKNPYISLASLPWKVYGLMSFHDMKHFIFLFCGMWNFGSLGIVGFFDDLKQPKMSMGMRFDRQNIWKQIIQYSRVRPAFNFHPCV